MQGWLNQPNSRVRGQCYRVLWWLSMSDLFTNVGMHVPCKGFNSSKPIIVTEFDGKMVLPGVLSMQALVCNRPYYLQERNSSLQM